MILNMVKQAGARAVELQEKLKELNFTAYLLNNNSEVEFQRIGFIAVLIM